jgi:ABC-type Fe3+/spermidine/putrescine transport system ATPase subunit
MDNIQLSSITKRFCGVEAISHLDLHIPGDKITALPEPAGCGMTTLLGSLALAFGVEALH